MHANATKAKLQRGELTLGLFVSNPDPRLVEYAAQAGLDFVRLDCEHGAITLESLENLVRAAEATGITPLARVPVNRPEVVMQHMDRGLAGVMFPHINTPDDATAAVRFTKFAPLGERGYSARGGHTRWAIGVTEPDEHEFANRETMVICLVEEVEGLENIEKIARVPGVDVVMLGQGDLCQSMGYIKDRGNPAVKKAVSDGIRRVAKAGKPAGITVPNFADVSAVREYIELGARMFHFELGSLLIWAMKDTARRIRA